MKRLFLFILLLVPFALRAQPKTVPAIGSVSYLDYKHSYKSIRLGSHISTLPQASLTKINDEEADDPATYYAVEGGGLTSLGNGVVLTGVHLKVYQGFIVSIYLFFDQSDGSNVKEILTAAYGKETNRNNALKDNYLWLGRTTNIFLTYEDSHMCAAIYSDNTMVELMEKHKEISTAKAASDL